MKKYLLPLLAALSLGCGTLSAQTITPLEDGKYDIKAGDVTMTVDAAHGGKIMSFRLGEASGAGI